MMMTLDKWAEDESCNCPKLWCWAKHLPTLELDFLICKMEVIVPYFISHKKYKESN